MRAMGVTRSEPCGDAAVAPRVRLLGPLSSCSAAPSGQKRGVDVDLGRCPRLVWVGPSGLSEGVCLKNRAMSERVGLESRHGENACTRMSAQSNVRVRLESQRGERNVGAWHSCHRWGRVVIEGGRSGSFELLFYLEMSSWPRIAKPSCLRTATATSLSSTWRARAALPRGRVRRA